MQVPTISLAASETRARAAIVDEIKAACLEHGFFLVKDYGEIVPPSLPERTLDAAHTFAMPEPTKRACFKKDHIWGGYEPFKALNLDPSNEKGHGLNEGFSIAPPYHPTAWPEESALPGFRDVLSEYHAAVTELAKYICSLIAEGLDLDAGYFEPFFERQLAHVKLAHYYRPKDQENEEGLFGVAPHSDWGAITVLLQDQIGGLEILESRTGQWIPVRPVPDTFVINLGDLLSRWTNDRYKSTVHRVIPPPTGVDRYSIPFFSQGNPDYVVRVIGCADSEARYPPIAAGDYLQYKFESTYKMDQ